jgi:hypothetical protein
MQRGYRYLGAILLTAALGLPLAKAKPVISGQKNVNANGSTAGSTTLTTRTITTGMTGKTVHTAGGGKNGTRLTLSTTA